MLFHNFVTYSKRLRVTYQVIDDVFAKPIILD